MTHRIVLVSGPPGAGKTTIAVPLAAELGFPLITKDHIKEAIWDAMEPPEGDVAWSRRIGGAAMDVLWTLASHTPEAVLEANFRPHSAYELSRLAALNADVVEVYCRCSVEEAVRRYNARGPGRHAAHVNWSIAADALSEHDVPMGVGPVIKVDTEAPVDAGQIAEYIRSLFSES